MAECDEQDHFFKTIVSTIIKNLRCIIKPMEIKKNTVILFLDAIRPSDLEFMPYLNKLKEISAFGPMESLAGYHIEFSILSGYSPIKHNVWTWFEYDPEASDFKWVNYFGFILFPLDRTFLSQYVRNFVSVVTCFLRWRKGKTRMLRVNEIPLRRSKDYAISVDKSFVDKNSLNVPTLFDILREKKISFFACEFPTFATNNRTFFSAIGSDDRSKVTRVRKELRKGRQIVFTHLWKLDSIKHKHGPDSHETRIYLAYVDSLVQEIMENEGKGANLVVFSDHGFTSVNSAFNVLDLLGESGLEEGKDYDIILDSTIARIWLKDIRNKGVLKRAFKSSPCLVIDEHNCEGIKIPYFRKNVGDVMIMVNPGYQISPNYFQGNSIAKGMHGYWRHDHELNGILLIHSNSVTTTRIEGATLIDVTPSILSMIGIDGYEFEGKSKVFLA